MGVFQLEQRVEQNLNQYLQLFPNEKNRFELLEKQIADGENLGTRKNFTGHMTASAYVLRGEEILMIHNINLDKRLAPGGHREIGDNELRNTAKREVSEEAGIFDCAFTPWHLSHHMLPLDIDTHFIPENPKKQEPSHYHHDFRYVFFLDEKQDIELQLEEVSAGGRQKLKNLNGDSGFESVKEKIIKFVLTQ